MYGEAYLETPLLHPQSLYGRRSLARSLAWSYADVITKFSRLDGLPIFITHGALLARFARTSSAIITAFFNEVMDITKTLKTLNLAKKRILPKKWQST